MLNRVQIVTQPIPAETRLHDAKASAQHRGGHRSLELLRRSWCNAGPFHLRSNDDTQSLSHGNQSGVRLIGFARESRTELEQVISFSQRQQVEPGCPPHVIVEGCKNILVVALAIDVDGVQQIKGGMPCDEPDRQNGVRGHTS